MTVKPKRASTVNKRERRRKMEERLQDSKFGPESFEPSDCDGEHDATQCDHQKLTWESCEYCDHWVI
jgi:hypothetical protein